MLTLLKLEYLSSQGIWSELFDSSGIPVSCTKFPIICFWSIPKNSVVLRFISQPKQTYNYTRVNNHLGVFFNFYAYFYPYIQKMIQLDVGTCFNSVVNIPPACRHVGSSLNMKGESPMVSILMFIDPFPFPFPSPESLHQITGSSNSIKHVRS